MNDLSNFNKILQVFKQIPFVRGLIARIEIRQQKHKLLECYSNYIRGINRGLFKSVIFDELGCRYVLNDGRIYLFEPGKSAGWLYSIPYSGTFENKETEFLRSLIKPGWVCIDVGGCFGWYTVLLSQLTGSQGKVFVFEPVPENADCLNANLRLNQCANVQLNLFALSDRVQESIEIYVPKNGVSGSLKAHSAREDCEVINIKTSTLDIFSREKNLERLDFLKADIEGAEFLLLKGGREALVRYKPILMLEVQASSTNLFKYHPQELFQFLREIEYEAYYVDENMGLVNFPAAKFSNTLPDYNFIFKPKNA
ncbi:FkbM family methyltransferase [Polynucleobacter sp.]|uniref:FkbM family methyltransferase n=1 Tax=Polynucleobacter sp. TaxID=2029855 RepID=UPI003F6A28FE